MGKVPPNPQITDKFISLSVKGDTICSRPGEYEWGVPDIQPKGGRQAVLYPVLLL